MNNQLNSINSIESGKHLPRSQRFVENAKRAVGKVLTKAGIGLNTILPMASTTTSTFMPTSVNTISVVAPTASTVIKAISLGTATSLLTACGGSEDGPDGPIDVKDTTAPTINISKYEVDISGGKQIRISGNQLYIGSEVVASWNDNKTKNCSVLLSINGKTITSGTTISEEGTLTIKVSDEAGNIKSSDIRLNKAVDQDISGLENLKNLNMQVDQEVNLLNGVTFGNGASLEKVEIEIDGQRVEVSNPYHYIPSYPGICSIIITVKDKNSKSTEYKVDNLTIKALEYKAMAITNIQPKEILPILGEIAPGYEEDYEYINQIKMAEATKIRDMMREYGAGDYSAEEYKQLMNRLNTGMMREIPKGYNNFEAIGWNGEIIPTNHAHDERNILNTLIKHANFKVISSRTVLHNLGKEDPNKINIIGLSMEINTSDKDTYNSRDTMTIKEQLKEKNIILFGAGGNIEQKNGHLLNKINQEKYEITDDHSVYTEMSMAHNKNDNTLNRHILITFGTNKNGDVDQTNELYNGSKFPVGFHNKILFSGRVFPYVDTSGTTISRGEKYTTSYTNYLNVAAIDILFQLKADTPDVDNLLEMVRNTALTNYIRLNGQTQELQLINPEGFFKKYLMPNNLPSSLQSSKTITLNKGYYKGVIFDIPGAEVKINGQWVAYNDTNKSEIKAQNPMTLEWRLNGDLCRKMGQKGKSVNGKIIVVDDKWNGLNIDKEFSVSIQ